ncbi:monovalent cation/H+ antiporter complex subunit F [Corallococcus macrosporus]|uniref:Cation:proton antiporter n=2 Tax=Myxococcaceae TaxID=31 RepID=A0A250JWT4_9BACT|nr:monovalent cation/H+ antiporter complex subunit F [Corallococcus macrosporus]AEI67392.1 MrpF/PhaF family monovalent cation/proton antiporter [Corallococcus macrosporus]ATB48183.1 cation:proton antiporter [Corallococcus macrosporus DSM 14697]
MSGWLHVITEGTLGAISIAMLFSLHRLVRGPSLTDRVVALDLFSLQTAAVITVYALWVGQPELVDVALVLAVIGSMGTLVIARYLYSAGKGHR